MTDALKPCPKNCPQDQGGTFIRNLDDEKYWGFCPRCGWQGPSAETEAEAIAAWNTRAPVPVPEEVRISLDELNVAARRADVKYQKVGPVAGSPPMSVENLMFSLEGYSRIMPTAGRAKNVMRQACKLLFALMDDTSRAKIVELLPPSLCGPEGIGDWTAACDAAQSLEEQSDEN